MTDKKTHTTKKSADCAKDSNTAALNQRAEQVLNALIDAYVLEGNPIGSKYLSCNADMGLSPATIRNVMAELERLGLIQAPHTSAGRVPTARGYRMYLNTVMYSDTLAQETMQTVKDTLTEETNPKAILNNVTNLLSTMTTFAGVVSTPTLSFARLKQIEFLKLSDRRILAILITDDGHVQNKVLETDKDYRESELVASANFFNDKYSTQSLDKVRDELIEQLSRDRRDTHAEMKTALSIAGALLVENETGQDSVMVSGLNNLITVPEFNQFDKIKVLLDKLRTKQVLYDLLQKSMDAQGVNIFIGEESGYAFLSDCSVISAPYKVNDQPVGVLGVIGPTRMPYERVIAMVDVTSKLISRVLTHKQLD